MLGFVLLGLDSKYIYILFPLLPWKYWLCKRWDYFWVYMNIFISHVVLPALSLNPQWYLGKEKKNPRKWREQQDLLGQQQCPCSGGLGHSGYSWSSSPTGNNCNSLKCLRKCSNRARVLALGELLTPPAVWNKIMFSLSMGKSCQILHFCGHCSLGNWDSFLLLQSWNIGWILCLTLPLTGGKGFPFAMEARKCVKSAESAWNPIQDGQGCTSCCLQLCKEGVPHHSLQFLRSQPQFWALGLWHRMLLLSLHGHFPAPGTSKAQNPWGWETLQGSRPSLDWAAPATAALHQAGFQD